MSVPAQDELWRGIIENLFEYFCRYFFPDWAENVADFTKEYRFLG